MRIPVLILLLLVGLAPVQAHDGTSAQDADAGPRVYIVRHAEKVAGDDPALTAAGQARAAALALLLRDAGIARIFTTDTRRARDTAAPLAAALRLEPEIYAAGKQAEFAARLRELNANVLVVGHSNTIDELAALLGVDSGEPVEEATEFDRLYVITLAADGVRGELRRYGNEAL